MKEVPIPNSRHHLLCDISTGTPRPVVPSSWQRKVFDVTHNLAHPGIRATRRLVSRKFVWKNLHKMIGEWTRHASSVNKPKYTDTRRHHWGTFRFQRVDLTTSTWIWMDHFRLHMDKLISSR